MYFSWPHDSLLPTRLLRLPQARCRSASSHSLHVPRTDRQHTATILMHFRYNNSLCLSIRARPAGLAPCRGCHKPAPCRHAFSACLTVGLDLRPIRRCLSRYLAGPQTLDLLPGQHWQSRVGRNLTRLWSPGRWLHTDGEWHGGCQRFQSGKVGYRGTYSWLVMVCRVEKR
jgi:hypothetical protein